MHIPSLSPDDLILPPAEPKRYVRYVNVYEDAPIGDLFIGQPFMSARAALDGTDSDLKCIARVRVEFVEGQFDE